MPEKSKKKPSELRVALLVLLLPLYLAVAFSFNYIGALHAPTPHHVKLAIVGHSSERAPLARRISAEAKGAFKILELSSIPAARRLVAGRELAGAYVPRPTPTIIVASAASPPLASFLENAFRRVAAARGQLLSVDDLRPLPSGNASGLASFFFVITCTLAAFLTVVALGAVAPTLPELHRAY